MLYARKVFAVTKVFAIMVMRWGDGCDLTSHEGFDASRAPSAKRQGRIARISYMMPKAFAISVPCAGPADVVRRHTSTLMHHEPPS